MDTMNNIKTTVENLSYPYQIIYGHPELSGNISRECIDREHIIFHTIDIYRKATKKTSLKILDIGCAQGYFCLKAAELGHEACGIDILEENIDCCRKLAEENNYTIHFETDTLSPEFIKKIKDEKYDVILALSVFHHVANGYGFTAARYILEQLSEFSEIIISEMAIKEEPVTYGWKFRIPDKYETWYDNIAFYKELGYLETHLSNVKRPIIVSSNKYFLFDNSFHRIDEYKEKSFDSPAKPRDMHKRVYFRNDLLLKYYRKDNQYSLHEMRNEIKVLTEHPDISFIPKLIQAEEDDKSISVLLKSNKGRLLWDVLKNNEPVNKDKVISDVLDNLIELENKGLYHNDIRIWNVCLDSASKAFLIDPGAISTSREDAANFFKPYKGYTFNVYESFITFVYDLLATNLYLNSNCIQITCLYRYNNIPEKYTNFIQKCLLQDTLSFSLIKSIFETYIIHLEKPSFTREEKEKLNNIQKYRAKAYKAGLKVKKSINRNRSTNIYLFHFIKIINIVESEFFTIIKLFGFNLLRVNKLEAFNKKTFYLFNIIPVYKITRSSERYKIKHYLFNFIPLLKIKKR